MSYLIAREVSKLCGRNEGFGIPDRLLDCVWEQVNHPHQETVGERRSDFIRSPRRANQSDCSRPVCYGGKD